MTLCDVCSAEGYPYNEETCKDCEYNPNREEKIRVTDLISKRQMVEKISDLFLDKYEVKANSDLTEFYKEVLKILINEKGKSDWISVKDRLPEDDSKYMVWCKDGWCKDDFEICEFDAESQTFGYTYDDYDEMYSHLVCWDDGINKTVTYWTYLPEPPESEDDAE